MLTDYILRNGKFLQHKDLSAALQLNDNADPLAQLVF